jgi:pimeloyl-ACP methyl ester carboxylesterase
LLAVTGLHISAGCATPDHIRSADRYQRGVVYILPGIEGRRPWNRDIALGLDEGGVTSAIEIYDWTVGFPGGEVVNLANLERNRRQARWLANKIVAYRKDYPGRPVHLIGHSGGGGIVVLTLEALPPGRQIDMAILLAPALSPDYDLSVALRRARVGVCNFYSERDVGFLKVGTTLFGRIDRRHGFSAGAVGFEIPESLAPEDRVLYEERLRQVAWDERLKRHGATGTHLGWASRRFAREYLAPLIKHNEASRPIPAEFVE